MYKNILVPVALGDDSNGSALIAVANALKADGGQITLLHVIEELQGYVAMQLPQGLEAENVEYAKAGLEKLAQGVAGGAQTKVVSGHSGRTILDEAETMGADCIVMGSHRPGLEDYLIGSTAARVVRHANCSVHVIR
jgi:universal stress protein F